MRLVRVAGNWSDGGAEGHGAAARGSPSNVGGSGGQRCNVLAAMTSTEVLMPYVHTGTCNAETFLDALRTSVVS
jgi:hypothetical protein